MIRELQERQRDWEQGIDPDRDNDRELRDRVKRCYGLAARTAGSVELDWIHAAVIGQIQPATLSRSSQRSSSGS